MIGAMVIPTGIEAKIGGHAGDGNAAARLLASACEKLIVHPNIVNAADFNGMTENMLYVEGSMLDRFLNGNFKLRERGANKITVFANEESDHTINCINTAKYVLGASVELSVFPEPLEMKGTIENGKAGGTIGNLDRCMKHIIDNLDCDAVAIHTPIDVEYSIVENYVNNGGVNPWGGIEATLSRAVADRIYMPVAHAPIEMHEGDFKGVGSPRLAPEYVSTSHLFSVLKGLHTAPRVADNGISNDDVDVLISAWCDGKPHDICRSQGIPIIYVRENETNGTPPKPGDGYFVENYLEAAGLISALKAGVSVESVRS